MKMILNQQHKTLECGYQLSLAGLCFVLCLLFSSVAYAQFSVKKNTILTLSGAESVISSQEEVHYFEASVLGEGSLYLNGKTRQQIVVVEQSSISNLRIENANQLELKTALSITNTLRIHSGTLHLNHALVIGKALDYEQDASIVEHAPGLLQLQNPYSYTCAQTMNYPKPYQQPLSGLWTLGETANIHTKPKPRLCLSQSLCGFYSI